MTLPWIPIVVVDIVGSLLMLMISMLCAVYAWQLIKKKPDDVFNNYIFLFTLAILFFSVSRSFGHLFKQFLILNDMTSVWRMISPFSGAVNSAAFVVIFAFGIYFHRFQKVHGEIEYYKENLERLVDVRTEELEEAKNTLENILNNSSPINITGIDFDLLQANEAYYEIWPLRGSDSGMVKCYQSRPGEHCHTDNCPMQLIINGEEVVTQEVSKVINDEPRDFIITAKPFRHPGGTLLGMVESFHEITLLKRAERTLAKMDQLKSEIISTAAHELNTPTSTIMGYSEFLRDPDAFGGFSEEQKKEFADEIFNRSEALSHLVSDLLDITRIESGKPIPMDIEQVEVCDFLQKAIKPYIVQHTDRKFVLDLPEQTACPSIPFDRNRISQILDNLLSNAIKYSRPGTTVTLSAAETERGWQIAVQDQGIGMNPEQLSHVFDKFYRADTSNTAAKGLGLGMSIVKQIVDSHHGEISVESAVGEGTKVAFTLPCKIET